MTVVDEEQQGGGMNGVRFTRSGRTQWTRSFPLWALFVAVVVTPDFLMAVLPVFGSLVDGRPGLLLGEFG